MNPFTGPIPVGYIRVSTDRQDLSLEAQTALLQRTADYHFPAGSLELFTESAISGSTEFAHRPEGRRLLARVRALRSTGREVTLIVPKVDRLGRDTIDICTTARSLQTQGANLMVLDLGVDTRTPTGWFMLQVISACAELELSRIRERIQTALNQKRAKGELTGTVPYGWDAVLTGEVSPKGVPIRKLVDNPTQQTWILRMEQVRELGWGYDRIARWLNTSGVPTRTPAGQTVNVRGQQKRTDGQWKAGNVQSILTNQIVTDWLRLQAQRARDQQQQQQLAA